MGDTRLAAGVEIVLPPEQSHYLANVLRLGVGEEVHVFNAAHGEWLGKIASSKKQEVRILLQEQSRLPLTSCALRLTLAFAPLKKTRTDFVVEKAGELGVHILQPVITDHTQAERVNVERLQTIAIEAAEQCDRLDAPTVLPPLKLSNYLSELPKDALVFLAAESGNALPIAQAFEKIKLEMEDVQNIHFLIGPEGGFSEKEFALFDRYPNIRRIRMGARLLRAETAAVAVLSNFQAILGDWQSK